MTHSRAYVSTTKMHLISASWCATSDPSAHLSTGRWYQELCSLPALLWCCKVHTDPPSAPKPATSHRTGKQSAIRHPPLPPNQIYSDPCCPDKGFLLCAFMIPAHIHRAWQKWRLIYTGALTSNEKEDGIFNSSKKCDIKLPASSYQTCLNIFGSPPSKRRILQSQFSSPVWRCWWYLAGWLLLAGKKQYTKKSD